MQNARFLLASAGCCLALTQAGFAARAAGQPAAPAPKAWGFTLPVRPPVPDAPAFTPAIDRLLEHGRSAKGLSPAPRASRPPLLRRAYLDLIGLPPTPAQTAAFLADTRPDAWARTIDALLASPHYGERWG